MSSLQEGNYLLHLTSYWSYTFDYCTNSHPFLTHFIYKLLRITFNLSCVPSSYIDWSIFKWKSLIHNTFEDFIIINHTIVVHKKITKTTVSRTKCDYDCLNSFQDNEIRKKNRGRRQETVDKCSEYHHF